MFIGTAVISDVKNGDDSGGCVCLCRKLSQQKFSCHCSISASFIFPASCQSCLLLLFTFTIFPGSIEQLHFHGNQKLRNDRTHCHHIVVQLVIMRTRVARRVAYLWLLCLLNSISSMVFCSIIGYGH